MRMNHDCVFAYAHKMERRAIVYIVTADASLVVTNDKQQQSSAWRVVIFADAEVDETELST